MATKKVFNQTATIEDEPLSDYELVLIISPEVTGETLDTTLDNIGQFITGQGGTVSSVDQWGKRKLAYSIAHFMEGYYVLTRLKVKAALSKELEARLRISEEVLRHLLIRCE
ncbi:30S ribosomal protein S6 [Chloroflexota bacterium]